MPAIASAKSISCRAMIRGALELNMDQERESIF